MPDGVSHLPLGFAFTARKSSVTARHAAGESAKT